MVEASRSVPRVNRTSWVRVVGGIVAALLLWSLPSHAQIYYYFSTDQFVTCEGGTISGTLYRAGVPFPPSQTVYMWFSTNVNGYTPFIPGSEVSGLVQQGANYTVPVSFGLHAASAPFSFSLNQDGVQQPLRAAQLVVGPPWPGAVQAPPGYIQYAGVFGWDDDETSVSVFSEFLTRIEGQTNRFGFNRSTNQSINCQMTFNFSLSGTAVQGTDYTLSASPPATLVLGNPNQLILPPAYPQGVINVVVTSDSVVENSEAVTVQIEPNPSNYTLPSGNDRKASFQISANYSFVNLRATDPDATETSGDVGVFTIERSGNNNSALTVLLSASGTATAGSDYATLPSSIVLAAGQVRSNLTIVPVVDGITEPAETIVLRLSSSANYISGLYTNAVVTIAGEGANPRDTYPKTERYRRGSGPNDDHYTTVVPLEGLKGTASVLLESPPVYATRYHYNGVSAGSSQTSTANRIAYNSPIARFGSGYGQALYIGQPYHIGHTAGTITADDVVIIAFNRQSGTQAGTIDLATPYLYETNNWIDFATNGFARTVEGYGLKVTLRDAPGQDWGTRGAGYHLTFNATSAATNYYYLVLGAGLADGQYMSLLPTAQPNFTYLYELYFEQRPSWRSILLDQPQFAGTPAPPDLLGKTPEELLSFGAPITHAVSLSPSACTNLNQSPELRRHPILDQLVSDLNRDPMALANYVVNEIDLTDAIAYRDDGQVASESVNLGGVNRGALGVYLEGQGSPLEQCSLLVYLLRQAGTPAAYVFPPDSGLKLLDARVGQLLRTRIKGGADEKGRTFTTNRLITVNYPWVAAHVGGQWIHLFPWLKDTQAIEGFDLYDYLPDPYKDQQLWVRDYIFGKTNLLSFATLDDDTPLTIYPRWLTHNLEQTAPGLSLDDLGMSFVNRRHLYATWSEFPRPTWVGTTSTAVESLTSSGITNVSPRLTNIFDTVSVELFSVANPLKRIATAELRMADLHNRRFYVSHSGGGGGTYQVRLNLAPFQPASTGTVGTFQADALTNKQELTLTLDGTDDDLRLRIRHRRQRALAWDQALDPYRSFLDLYSAREVLQERALRKGDVAAICFNAGRVTPAMVRRHAEELWAMERLLSTNSGAASTISADVYQGSLTTLAGMSYYERVSRFDGINRKLHKVQNLSTFAMGLSKLSPRRNADGSLYNNSVDPIWPNVDMFFQEVTTVGNGTARLDSNWDRVAASRNYFNLSIADGSAQEHAILNQFYGQSNSVSTVKLLQLAQSKATNGAPGIVELHFHNYLQVGETWYEGQLLRLHNPGMWEQVKEMFERPGTLGDVVAWLPPGNQTTPSGSFSGMAALILGVDRFAALIGNNQYGGYGQQLPPSTISANTLPQWRTGIDSDGDVSHRFYDATPSTPGGAPEVSSTFDLFDDQARLNSGAFLINPIQTQEGQLNGYLLNGSQGTYAGTYDDAEDLNVVGKPDDRKGNSWLGTIADPVNTMTGEFYVDEVDLTLAGPFPLEVRRNYGSHNLASAQLGTGWKLNYMPSLGLTTTNVIYAAEADGSVIALTAASTNTWSPGLSNNPTLNNHSTLGVGGIGNRLNMRLARFGTTYYLTNSDGSLRIFEQKSFPLAAGATWDRQRPYLTQWIDNRGNSLSFEYGTNSTATDYGQVRRVVNSNGGVIRMEYDVFGRVVEAYSLDGRRVRYDYNQHGDLVRVTRPDASEIEYEYQLAGWTPGGITNLYSTHLLTKELRPDGRVLRNEFDDQRRVTNQWATVGPDLRLVRNATFRYTNNFALTNIVGTLSGTTTVLDYTNRVTHYAYTNGLVRRLTDPLGQALVQEWYESTNSVPPAYPRSLKRVIDKRGLITEYLYDSRGNITNLTVKGDLKGDGDTNVTSTTSANFNSDNLLTLRIDPTGTTNLLFYTNRWLLARAEIWPINAAPSQGITNLYGYYNVTGTGSAAYGLRQVEIRAAGSLDAATNLWTHDSRGFVTILSRPTGTGDPTVVVTNLFNNRGELVEQADFHGRRTRFAYDPSGRPQMKEVYENATSIPLAWEYSYYNENGEMTWSDGPKYNPEDYVWRDYDGAGRLSTEIRWRIRGNLYANGVEPVPGDELYATTFQEFDPMGNLRRTINPRGVITTNLFDALDRQTVTETWDSTGLLSRELASYEPGGKVAKTTNALGGVTERLYTQNGLPKFQRNPDGSTNAWRYRSDGRIEREITRNGAYEQTSYDDANRKVVRVFYAASGGALSTNTSIVDRRGNAVLSTDASGWSSTNLFDALDRLKVASAPRWTNQPPGAPALPDGPPIFQQVTTHLYDASGQTHTVSNAVGEKVITVSDALGRPLTVSTLVSNNPTPIRVTENIYSPDHHSVTAWSGTGAFAVGVTSYTDESGREVLRLRYPDQTRVEYALTDFDAMGNPTLTSTLEYSGVGFGEWTRLLVSYDGRNRPTSRTDLDGATTQFRYDPMGNVTNRIMPGGLEWRAKVDAAGRMTEEKNTAPGGGTARLTTYSYYSSNSPFAGLLQSKTDARAVVSTFIYDPWLRVATNASSGSIGEHNLTTINSFNPRGELIRSVEFFASTNTGPSITNEFLYTPDRKLSFSGLELGTNAFESTSASYDSAGRRVTLNLQAPAPSIGSFTYRFGWRPDGLLASVIGNTGGAAYDYTDGGLLQTRTVAPRVTTVTARDGTGRPLTRSSVVAGTPRLSETLSWWADGAPATHTQARTDFTDARSFTHQGSSRRLSQERLNLDGAKRWTNSYAYDSGTNAGPGVLTRIGNSGANAAVWSGTRDAFQRITWETNTVVRKSARGRMNGLATTRAFLNGQPQALSVVSRNDTAWPYEFRAELELSPGTHQLIVQSTHPSGQYITNSTVTFTNSIGTLTSTDTMDAAGFLTQRLWKNPNGTTNRLQTLVWDSKGRLAKVTERDGANNGRNVEMVYDTGNRLRRSKEILVTNAVLLTTQPIVIDHYYDPLVEFLELGVNENGRVTWKIMGPDSDGTYGGQNGTGGFEAIVPGPELFCPIVSDAYGNLVAVYDPKHTNFFYYPSRLTGYGAVAGYRPVPVGQVGADLGAKYAYRNRGIQSFGLMWLGANWYDPVSGQFVSFDPLGHDGSPSGYSFCNGNPYVYWDHDGRFAVRNVQDNVAIGVGVANGLMNFSLDFGEMAGQAMSSAYPGLGWAAGAGMEYLTEQAEGYGQGIFDSITDNFDTRQGNLYAAGGFVGEVAPNFIPVAGMEKAAGQVMGKLNALAGKYAPFLTEDIGAAMGRWMGVERRSLGVNRGALFTPSELAGVERASQQLIDSVGQRRAITWATEGSDALRYLEFKQAEASAFPASGDVFLRPNPSKAAVLEEFLHGTQSRLGIIDRLGRDAAEGHVKDFMIRHRQMLGLGNEDIARLIELKRRGL